MSPQAATPPIEAELRELAAEYPSPRLALLPVVQRVAERGTPHAEAIDLLVSRLGYREDAVRGLLAAYWPAGRSSRPSRQGRLCLGLTCVLNGAREIWERAARAAAGAGGEIEIGAASCLGCCFAAPVFEDPDGSVRRLDAGEDFAREISGRTST